MIFFCSGRRKRSLLRAATSTRAAATVIEAATATAIVTTITPTNGSAKRAVRRASTSRRRNLAAKPVDGPHERVENIWLSPGIFSNSNYFCQNWTHSDKVFIWAVFSDVRQPFWLDTISNWLVGTNLNLNSPVAKILWNPTSRKHFMTLPLSRLRGNRASTVQIWTLLIPFRFFEHSPEKRILVSAVEKNLIWSLSQCVKRNKV